MRASGLELKTGASIMAIGGFTGGDDSPTLEQFQALCRRRHEVRYFIAGEPFGPPGRHESGAASEITSWVEQNFTPIDVGGTTVYDLSAPASLTSSRANGRNRRSILTQSEAGRRVVIVGALASRQGGPT